MSDKPFKLRSGNKPSFKNIGSSPLGWHKEGHDKTFFQSVHGAITGTEGKKFKDTQFGQYLKKSGEQIKTNIKAKEPLLENVLFKDKGPKNGVDTESKDQSLVNVDIDEGTTETKERKPYTVSDLKNLTFGSEERKQAYKDLNWAPDATLE